MNKQHLLARLAYSQPIIGTVRIGGVKSGAGGKRLPEKDDQFTITEQYKMAGMWVKHELNYTLRKGDEKLRAIPIQVISPNTSLVMDESYVAFATGDTENGTLAGTPLCVGRGEQAKRLEGSRVDSVECVGPLYCQWGKKHRCDVFLRFMFRIVGQDDDFGAFVLRSGSITTARTMRVRLEHYAKLFGQGLPGVTFTLMLVPKSSTQSKGSTYYYLDIKLAKSLAESRADAEAYTINMGGQELLSGLDQLMVELRANGALAESIEDVEQFEDILLARVVDEESGREITLTKATPGETSAGEQTRNMLTAAHATVAALQEAAAAKEAIRSETAGVVQ